MSDGYTGKRASSLEVDAWFKHKQLNVLIRESIHYGSVTAVTLWNALPNNSKTSACLATFKARLKTHFFLTFLAA